MTKEIMVSNGTNDCKGETRATTEDGYIRAAKRVWPYAGLSRVNIRVWDPEEEAKGNNPIIFECQMDLC